MGKNVFMTILRVVFVLPVVNAARPHIIFILADDMGWNDFSFHGSDEIQTPNIDALAYSGVILNQHYTQPICTPTRSALMTGRYPSNIGMQGSPLSAGEPRALPRGKILPQYFKDLGYTTRIVGKWHLGYYKKEFTPTHRGFDSFLGYLNGFTSYYDHINQESASGVVMEGLDFRRNSSAAWDLSGRYATDIFTEEAARIIREHNPSIPLFLYLAHLASHAGNAGKLLEAPQESVDMFSHIVEPNRRTYAAMVSKLDESVGRIVGALWTKGMLENSIIVFTSDNGAPSVDVVGYQNWGSNYPLRGLKTTQWEGGIRTPAVVWSPVLGRRVSDQLMHVTDWLPTLISAAGGTLQGVPLDGVDQWSALLEDTVSPRTEVLLQYDEVKGLYAARREDWKITNGSNYGGEADDYYGHSGTDFANPPYNLTAVAHSVAGEAIASLLPSAIPDEEEMLLMRAESTVTCALQADRTPCKPSTTPNPCLFDVAVDPCETNNLALRHPEVLQEMLDLVSKYKATLIHQLNKPVDVNGSDPRKFNNTWSPWVDS
ncbi:arylsulfatase B-like isoform X2 [Zootermopsis nevadensis]|nr:arylsulfatase B-like isoform X2 [Zootermopsis nevadensis]